MVDYRQRRRVMGGWEGLGEDGRREKRSFFFIIISKTKTQIQIMKRKGRQRLSYRENSRREQADLLAALFIFSADGSRGQNYKIRRRRREKSLFVC